MNSIGTHFFTRPALTGNKDRRLADGGAVDSPIH